MATPNVVPRADQEGGLGTAAKSWGKLFIENPTSGGTAAVTVSNLDADQIAVDINANNTTANILDIVTTTATTGDVIAINASGLTTGSAVYLDIDDTVTGSDTLRIQHLDYRKAGVTGSGETRAVYGIVTTLLDTSTNHASGNVTLVGHEITLVNSSAQGTIQHTGLKITCNGADTTGTPSSSHGIIIITEDGGVDIATRSSADGDDTFTIATAAAGATTISTIDDGGSAADLDFVIDGKMVITPADMTGVVFHLDADADTDNIVDIDAGALDVDANSVTVDAADNITISAADNLDLKTATADGLLTLFSAHTAGQAIHIDGDANVGSEVDIDAGILDINVSSTATIDAATSLTITTPALTLSGASTIFSSSQNGEPVVEIRNEHNGGTGGKLKFNNTEAGTDGGDGDYLGTIDFAGNDDGTPTAQTYASINSRIHDASSGTEAGRLNFQIATNNGSLVEALHIKGTTSSTQPTMEINADVDIDGAFVVDGAGFSLDSSGTASNITVASDGAADDLTISLTGATDSSILMTSAGTGTDAVSIDVTAGDMVIAPSLADGKTLSVGKANATQMVFSPHGTAASEKISIINTSGTADDAIKIDAEAGGLTLAAGNDSLILDADGTDADAIKIDSAGGLDIDVASTATLDAATSLEVTSPLVKFTSTTTQKPSVYIQNNTDDDTSPELNFINLRGGSDGGDGDYLGVIGFSGMDDGTPTLTQYATISARIDDATNTEESGKMLFRIANHNGTLGTGFELVGGSESGEVDATLGLGANSVVTVPGNISLSGGGSVTVASSGDAEDLTLSVTGSTDSSVIIESSGTGADAIKLNSSVGSIDIDATDNITIEARDDISLTTSTADGLISLVSAHTAGQAIHIDGDADAGSIVDIDAGILEIDVTGDADVTVGGRLTHVVTGDTQLAGYTTTADMAKTISFGESVHKVVAMVNLRDANTTDHGVIKQLPGIKIPQHAHIREITFAVKQVSNLSTYNVELVLGTNDGVAAGTVPANYHEVLGAAANFSYSTDSASSNVDVDMGTSSGSAKKVWYNNRTSGVGFGDGELTDDHYVYVCSAGTGNGTTDGTAGIVCVTIDYIGID